MMSKMRDILLGRLKDDHEEGKYFDAKEIKDIEGKLDAISATLISLKHVLRTSDDQLIMELFNSQERWHLTTASLIEINQKLNQRLISLEDQIRVFMLKNM